jgi:hypothetical protein
MKTSGTFRLPLSLRANQRKTKAVINSSPQPKRRVVTYLPPPKITAYSQKPIVMENASQSRNHEMQSIEPIPKAGISGFTIRPSHHTSKGDSAQEVSPDHNTQVHSPSVTSNSDSFHRQPEIVPLADDITRIDMAELERNYPRTKMMISEVRQSQSMRRTISSCLR